jgi:8-oxo-dGTP pyrophosphatase MutT (NUDIX family)
MKAFMEKAIIVSSSNMNQAAGVFFYSKSTRRYLYLLRADSKNPTWSMPGGGIDQDETLFEGIARECNEEMEFDISDLKLIPIQKFVNNNFIYHTFFCEVEEEFIPALNDEHVGYAWVKEGQYPKPLHPGLFSTVNIDIVLEKLNSLT